jgi:hypothetical protein
VLEERVAAVALCDRGTLDGVAYWPDSRESFEAALGTSVEQLIARYTAVIHLRTPSAAQGYNNRNALRVESASEAMELDERVAAAWEGHPRRTIVDNTPSFLDKAARAIAAIRAELPPCCRGHLVPEIDRSLPEPQGLAACPAPGG